MKCSPLHQFWAPVVCAALLVGCAGRGPGAELRVPRTAEADLPPGSTTGDADACAAALGNPVSGAVAEGWPGLVASRLIPQARDGAGTSAGREGISAVEGNANAGAPGSPAAGPTGNVGVVGMPNDGAWGLSGLGLPAAREVSANGVIIGNIALVALPATEHMAVTPAIGEATIGDGSDTQLSAFTRVQQSCTSLAEIRVVTEPADRARLAEVAAAMRKGEPVVEYLPELTEISRRASTAPGSAARPAEAQ
mgnify:CR=1 FL=1